METASRLSSLPTRSTPHSSRRLSSNSSLSSLSELGMLEPRRGSGSGSSKTVSSSSPSSSVHSNNSSSNMMKKLGSRFTLKRNDGVSSAPATSEDAIEELADENEAVLATARPRGGRTLASSNASTARPSSIYGSLSQSGDTNRLRHRSSISNLNSSSSSTASTSSNGGNASVQRQPGTLRHRASMSSLSGSDSATSPPTTALRQPGTLRKRSSISSLSGSLSKDIKLTSPPSTAVRQPGALRHRSSMTSLSSIAMANPTTLRTATSTQAVPSRIRTMSTAAAPSRPSNFPPSANESSNTSAIGSLSNARRLSATHTGLASLRARTTSLISPPQASSGLHRPLAGNGSTAMGDTSIARRGIPKSSTTSIARIASTSSSTSTSTSSVATSHKRIGSLANRSPFDSTPKSSSTTASGLRRLQKESMVENSPGLEDLVNNTTLQMADLKDMLSPIAVSRISANYNKVNHHVVGSSSSSTAHSQDVKRMNTRTPIDKLKAKDEIENSFSSPSKSSLPVLHRTAPSTKATKNGSSSPSPSKNRIKSGTIPKKASRLDTSRVDGSSEVGNHPAPALTLDGLPALPGSRSLAPPSNVQPFPSTSSSNIKRQPPSPALSDLSRQASELARTPRIRTMKESSDMTDDDEMERLLSQEGFLSPARNLAGDSSTLLMQNDLSNVMMTPFRTADGQASSLARRGKEAQPLEEKERKALIEKLVMEEREKVQNEMKVEMDRERMLLDARLKEQADIAQRKLDESEMEFYKQSKEVALLQKMLANEANSAVRVSQLESQLSKQEAYDSNIRKMKRDLEDVRNVLHKEQKDRIVDKTRDIWKGYGKELEIEKDIVSGQLESLDQIRGLVGHVAMCVERNLEKGVY